MRRWRWSIFVIVSIVAFGRVGHVSTHVNVERKNEFFAISSHRSFGKSVGGVDASYGSRWVNAHERLFALIEEPVFAALGALKKSEKIGILPLSQESRSCEGWAGRGIPSCRAQVQVKLDSVLLKQIEKSAPKEMLQGQDSIFGSEDSLGPGASEVSLRAATGQSELLLSVQFVAASNPDTQLVEKVGSAVLGRISAAAKAGFPSTGPKGR